MPIFGESEQERAFNKGICPLCKMHGGAHKKDCSVLMANQVRNLQQSQQSTIFTSNEPTIGYLQGLDKLENNG